MVWYSHLFQNFPQCVVIHTVKGFGIVNDAEIDVFLESSCLFMIQRMLAVWFLVPLPSLNPAWTFQSYRFTYCWSLVWRILDITLLAWVSPVAQLVKNPPAKQETWARSLGWEDPLEKGVATNYSILAWRIPWTVQSMGLQKVRHDWVTFTFIFRNTIS